MAAMAICAHYLLDTGIDPYKKMRLSTTIYIEDVEQETIGIFIYIICTFTIHTIKIGYLLSKS